MSNKGLKSYTTNLDFNLGGITGHVNLFKADANLILQIPILNTAGFSTINLSLIYNKQNFRKSSYFGNGFQLNYFNKLIYNDSSITLENSDGSSDVYTKDDSKYILADSDLSIEKNILYNDEEGSSETTYSVLDPLKNCLMFSEDYPLYFPKEIFMKNGENLTLSETDSYFLIDNNNNNTVYLYKTYDKVTSIVWKNGSTEVMNATLTYSASYLKQVTVYKSGTIIRNYSIVYETDSLILTDEVSERVIKFIFDNNEVTQVEEYMKGYELESIKTNISYSTYRTIVTDEVSHSNTYVFDVRGLLRFVKDENNNISSYNYDVITKKITSEAFISDNLEKENLLAGKTVNDFTISDCTISSQTLADSFYSQLIGDTEYCVSGNGSLTYIASGNFLAGDYFKFIVWYRNSNNTSSINGGYIEIYDNNGFTSKSYMEKNSNDTEYNPLVVGLKLARSSKNIHLRIVCDLNNVCIGKVELLKQKFGSLYEYDEKQISNVNENGNVTAYIYEDGLVKNKLSRNLKGVINKYDHRNRITESLAPYQVKQTKKYDSKNRVLKSTTKDFTETEILESVNTYPSNLKSNLGDELEYVTSTEKDVCGNLLKITGALGYITEYHYNARMQIDTIKLYTNINSTQLLNTSITYDSQHHNKISTVTLKNNSVYSFGYDVFDRIEKVYLNNILLVTYSYDKFNNILTIKYGTNGSLISFTYEKGNIKTITFDGVTYTYTYNEFNGIKSIKKGNVVVKTIQYDTNGRVKKVLDEESNEIEYGYDNSDNVNKRTRTVDGLVLYESYDLLYRSFGTSDVNMKALLEYESLFYSGLMMENSKTISCGYSYIYPNSTNTKTPTVLDNVPCVGNSSSEKLSYNINGNDSKTTFGFFIRSTYAGSVDILRLESGNKSICVSLDADNYLCLYVNNGTQTKVISTTRNLSFKAWTFLCLTYESFNTYTKFSMFVDGEVFDGYLESAITLENKIAYAGYDASCNIAGIIMKNNETLDNNVVFRFYRVMQDYVINKKSISNALDFSNTTLYPQISDYRIYPLNQHVRDITGNEAYDPVDFYIRETIEIDNDRNFNFNTAIGRYVYVADGTKLNYLVDDGGNVTIGMRFYLEKDYDAKQYLFEMLCSDSKRVGVFLDKDGLVCLEHYGNIYTTSVYLNFNKWNFIALSVTETVPSDSVDEVSQSIKLLINTTTYEKIVNVENELSSSYLSIGRKYYDNIKETKFGMMIDACPLMGQIEMLAIKNTGSSFEELISLKNNIVPITKTTGYDEFLRYKGTYINVEDLNLYKKVVNYKTRSNTSYSSFVPSSETFNYYYSHTRNYLTDSLGRVTSITDSVCGNHTYEYDEKGFLTKADEVVIEYDGNGNIAKLGEKVFTYDSTVKDKLVSFNGKSITYSDTNPLNPTQYDGKTFNWFGRMLKSIRGTVSLDFGYNDKGLRISKSTSAGNIEYYYDEDLLITEKRPNCRLDYLYDENNQLYGFIYNSNTKYFYMRDILQNINGIIDINGNLVVKYDYTSFGVCTILSDTSSNNIGTINPFRFKGYYYDVETGLFMVGHRYYNPEWGRWIQPDDIEYLDPTNINGLNLYAYCNNDPVNMYDPTGHFGIGIALLIGMGIGAIFGGAISGASAYKDGERGWDLFWDIAGGAVMGAATGAAAVLGGAAGLTAVGGTVAGYGLSATAALGISMGATAIGGMAKYGFDYIASPNANQFSAEQFVFSGFNGAIQGMSTFLIAYTAGKNGVFNKTFNMDFINFYSKAGVTMGNLTVGILNSNIGAFLTKLLLSTAPAALSRFLLGSIIVNDRR